MWKQTCWGVTFNHRSPEKGDGNLVGAAWAGRTVSLSEPLRALLFNTREEARNWCTEKNKAWRLRCDFMSTWVVRPVKVVETVRVCK